MTRVLVTGANGFVGRAVCRALSHAGHDVRAALREPHIEPLGVTDRVVVGEIGAKTDWRAALREVSCVVHAAARVHIIHASPAAASLYEETNAGGTQHLADCAAEAGVRRFLFLSSIKVNGEETAERPYTGADSPNPQDAYARSKLHGEHALTETAARTGMQAVIVRPPIIYGPGVRANFLRLMRWIDRGWPLPLGAVRNHRSQVSIWNLCSLLTELLHHPEAPGRIWMASDAEDLPTPELIRRIGAAMRRRVRLLPVPLSVLKVAGKLTGRSAEIARLCGSLTVDIAQTRSVLGWSPPCSTDDSLARTVEWYLSEGRALAS